VGARRSLTALAALALLGCSSSSGSAQPDAAVRAHDAGPGDAHPDSPRTPHKDAAHADARHDAPTDAAREADTSTFDAPPDAPVPAATSLSLSLPMTPAFSTTTYDYYVRCEVGDNAIAVTMTAAPGSTIGLLQPTVTEPSTSNSLSVSVPEGAAIVAAVTTGATTQEYWVRCLPSDFSPLELDAHPDAGTPSPGYYLVDDVFTEQPAVGGYAMALDTNGVPVWYGKTANQDQALGVDNLIPGTLSYWPYFNETFSDSANADMELHDLLTGTVSYVGAVGVPIDLHELRVLSNGDYLIIADPIIQGYDLTGLPYISGTGYFGPDSNILGCIIQEIDPAGSLVWQWDALEHFDPVQDSTYPVDRPVQEKGVVNVFHCNSVDVDEATGDLLVSARNMDSVFRVARPSGKVLWKMGGARFNKDGAPYIAVTGDPRVGFYRQHDARFAPGGNISMLDDHTGVSGPSRATIYSYDLTSLTATLVWEYPEPGGGNAGGMGSVRVQPDGARVVGWGSGTINLAFSEIDAAGNDLFDFYFTNGRWTYRAIKIPPTAFDIDVLRKSVALP
jgi:hypothetical protein